jgi:hypothetical protein
MWWHTRRNKYLVFRRNGRVHLNRAGASVQSTTGSRGVRITGSNAGYTIFRGSVKGTGYPLHSPVSPSYPLPCLIVCHHISTGLNALFLSYFNETWILPKDFRKNIQISYFIEIRPVGLGGGSCSMRTERHTRRRTDRQTYTLSWRSCSHSSLFCDSAQKATFHPQRFYFYHFLLTSQQTAMFSLHSIN